MVGFFNALRNVLWKQYQGTQWRLDFIRSGLNFNDASQITDKITDIISAYFSQKIKQVIDFKK